MHRPALVTPPAQLPISVEKVKAALRIDGSDLDDEVESQIRAAVAHYEGWGGELGIALVEQTWSQSFDRFFRDMALPIGPVIGVNTVQWRNEAGELGTVPASVYALRIDGGGSASVQFDRGYSFPSGLHESGAVTVQYRAGWESHPLPEGAPDGAEPESGVPADILAAIKLRVQMGMDQTGQQNWDVLARAEKALVGKYRRLWI